MFDEIDKLRPAYKFLSEMKSGMDAGQEIGDNDFLTLDVLREDLVPEFAEVPVDQAEFDDFLRELFIRDSHWNRRLCEAICDFYDQIEQGNADIAASIAEAFLNECPSVWYRSHMAAISEQ